jgi:hypothetical protein
LGGKNGSSGSSVSSAVSVLSEDKLFVSVEEAVKDFAIYLLTSMMKIV